MSALQQINIAYELEQDRLLLRASTNAGQEYRIWLTRRFADLLSQVLQGQIEKAGGMHQIASHRHTTDHLRQGAFDREYDSSHKDFPLGEAGILAYSINVGDLQHGCSLQLRPREGQGMTINLDASLLYLMANLLEQATLQADWKLPGAAGLHSSIH